MSDYLSTLAARSLRREPACEPRRAQMFEPRTEAQGVETVEGAAVETPPTASTGAIGIDERDAGALAEPRAEASSRPAHGPTRAESGVRGDKAHESPHQTTHIRQSEDVPVPETTDTPVVRHAQTETLGEKPTPQATRGATVTPQASHINVARTDEFADSPPPVVLSRRSSSDTERAVTPSPAPQAEALDEKGRDETRAVAPRSAQLAALNAKSEVNLKSTPRPRASSSAQASEALPDGVSPQLKPAVTTEVRPLNAQPAATETRAAALTSSADYAAPVQGRGAGLNGVATAREVTTQAPPTIEISIGRIEVRAVTPPAPPPASRQKSAPPRMSLDDYLRAQSGGRS